MRTVISQKIIGYWMLALAAMVFVMAIIGAVTRLTESGLSMVEWHLMTDMLPPLNTAAWQEAFDTYKTSPQYRLVMHGMTLADYKHIYFWEWLHRLWGRLLGIVFALPLLWFIAAGKITRALLPRFLTLFTLGALQGFLGWFMVRSGLVDRPSVSHYRLAMHLMLAVVLYLTLLWNGLAILFPARRRVLSGPETGVFTHACIALGFAATTMVWGAFVAGLRAGLVYNTFPLMGGHLTPPDLLFLQPVWLNFFANPAAVQFTHRVLALTTLVVILSLWRHAAKAPLSLAAERVAAAAGIAALAQVGLGISTLLLMVPVPLAALHQAGALTVVTLLVCLIFALYEGEERIAESAPSAAPQN
jgi:cytochrome c oxidase assembly protein subunit 15